MQAALRILRIKTGAGDFFTFCGNKGGVHMAIIKCKMCGGDIELSADKSYGVCEFCGSTMTLPKVDDEQRFCEFSSATVLHGAVNPFKRYDEYL